MILKINAYSHITWLKVANEYAKNKQIKAKLLHEIDESNVKPCLIFFQDCV